MYYESFLFTRSQRRDFTAFIRPKDLTNREVSTIASALNYVQAGDLANLTADWPSLYCFPIGAYVLLLRHYDSGRKHAGREIGIIEGIAVRRTQVRHFALALPHILAHADELLSVAATVIDLEAQTIETSPEREWLELEAADIPSAAFVTEFVTRQADERLFLPFNETGRSMLLATLSDRRFPSLYFGFGTNADVLTRLLDASVDVDIVSFFNTTQPAFRNRATNAKSGNIDGYESAQNIRPRKEPPSRKSDAPAASDNGEKGYNKKQPNVAVPTPARRRTGDFRAAHHDTEPDRPTTPLTPREMKRQLEREAAARSASGEISPRSQRGLIYRLLRWLKGS
ncbi:MAG: hypothetical protein H7175_19525 [Burkholderiales bacterium]|nr:hypothetical protein [Anaerolineae bacterium]